MDLLLATKNSQNPYVVTIGDKIYYLKESAGQKFYAGCSYVSDIFVRTSEQIIAFEGSVPVDDVVGIMVVVLDEETGDTFKLHLKRGQFTYSYKNWVYVIHGMREVIVDEED